jgi:hypothetical protein
MEKAAARVKSGLRGRGPPVTSDMMDAKTERERRLAEALRANLRRRKAQARALEVQPDGKDLLPPDDDPSPDASSQ